jgi:hypothetical protein
VPIRRVAFCTIVTESAGAADPPAHP